jgi:uncharacterized protein YeaO (DUF488 family)
MSIFIVQLGTPRKPREGLRLGTVWWPPCGVPKSDFARIDYYDVSFSNLSPRAELVKTAARDRCEKARRTLDALRIKRRAQDQK